MDLHKIIEATKTAPPFTAKAHRTCGWDAYISRQLLEVHLNPDIELASRKASTIATTVDWIRENIPGERLEILDLGCGPGLYAEKLARLGA